MAKNKNNNKKGTLVLVFMSTTVHFSGQQSKLLGKSIDCSLKFDCLFFLDGRKMIWVKIQVAHYQTANSKSNQTFLIVKRQNLSKCKILLFFPANPRLVFYVPYLCWDLFVRMFCIHIMGAHLFTIINVSMKLNIWVELINGWRLEEVV